MKSISQREVVFRKEVENCCMKRQRGETSYGLGWQEMAVRECKTWLPELGNPIFVITLILPLFTDKKGEFFVVFCSLVKRHFSVFLVPSFQSHIVEPCPISPLSFPAVGGQSEARCQQTLEGRCHLRAGPQGQYRGAHHAPWLSHNPEDFHSLQARGGF